MWEGRKGCGEEGSLHCEEVPGVVRICVFFTLFGYWVRRVCLPRDWCTTCESSFSP